MSYDTYGEPRVKIEDAKIKVGDVGMSDPKYITKDELMTKQVEELQSQVDCDACKTLCDVRKVHDNGWFDFLKKEERHDGGAGCYRDELVHSHESLIGLLEPPQPNGQSIIDNSVHPDQHKHTRSTLPDSTMTTTLTKEQMNELYGTKVNTTFNSSR